MKKFKIADCWISIILIGVFFVLSFIKRNNFFITAYCVVGGWQVISMIVHAFTGYFTKIWGRRFIYHWGVVIMLGLFPFTMWVLVYIAPLMAIYYAWLCYEETFVLLKRPMELLK